MGQTARGAPFGAQDIERFPNHGRNAIWRDLTIIPAKDLQESRIALVLGMDALELGLERRDLSPTAFWLYLATPIRSFSGRRRP
jgi:hypothetical protein